MFNSSNTIQVKQQVHWWREGTWGEKHATSNAQYKSKGTQSQIKELAPQNVLPPFFSHFLKSQNKSWGGMGVIKKKKQVTSTITKSQHLQLDT